MKKNKKLLMYFLALNTIASSYLGAAPMPALKADKMYNSVINNIEKGKSNEGNYKLIERILKQKNKELKDLYTQNDYVVKPEYLEWQVFFTGFYDEYGKGVDNSKENAEYHSKVTGYYDEDGNYIPKGGSVNGLVGKPYQTLQKAKDINLGVNIPMKGIKREPLNLSLTPAGEININPNTLNVIPPTGITIPLVDPVAFQPITPSVSLPMLINVATINIGGAGGANNNETGFFPAGDNYRNSIISQMDLTTGKIQATTSGAAGNYSYSLINLVGTPAMGESYTAGGNPLANVTTSGSVTGVQGILKTIDNAVSRYGIEITLGGGVAAPAYLEQIFHYDEHYINGSKWKTIDTLVSSGYISAAEGQEFEGKYLDKSIGDMRSNKYLQYSVNTGNWNLKGNSVLAMNIQSHGADSAGWTSNIVFANKGKIIGFNESVNGILPQKQVAFMFTEGTNSYRYQVVDNVNLVELRAPESVVYSLYNVNTDLNGKYIMMNNGDIKLYGRNNVGIYTKGQTGGSVSNTQIKLYEPITVLGDESIGVDIERVLDFTNSKIKVNIGTKTPRQDVADSNGVTNLENSDKALVRVIVTNILIME